MKDKNGNKLPDFLIVGAAKSGTSSVYHYLNDFSDIFMSEPKETRFITSQFLNLSFKGKGDKEVTKRFVKTYKDFIKLFEKAPDNSVIGEGSPDNLYYYEEAIPKIKEILGDPKIIILLRNPVERAFSAYMHLILRQRESLSFKEAIELEKERIDKNYAFIWHYLKAGRYYNQVKAYKEGFPNVKVVLFDDLKKEPVKIIKELRSFLNLEEIDFNFSNEKFNQSGKPKYPYLRSFLIKRSYLKKYVSFFLPTSIFTEMKNKVLEIEKTSLLEEDRKYLEEYFKTEIINLQELTGRDLSHWL